MAPRRVLEIRHFVYRATRILAFIFAEDSHQWSIILFLSNENHPGGTHSDPYKPRTLRFNFSFQVCVLYVLTAITIWTNKRYCFTCDVSLSKVNGDLQKLSGQVLQLVTSRGPCDSGGGGK